MAHCYAQSTPGNGALRVLTDVSHTKTSSTSALGSDCFMEHAVPNFFFHINHAYAILRDNGVGLGKRGYLGTLGRCDPYSGLDTISVG